MSTWGPDHGAVSAGLALFFQAGEENKRCRWAVTGQVGARILNRAKENDHSKAKGSSWTAAGASGGGREGSPRWSRIFRVVSGGRIVAKIRRLPPQRSQVKTSAANTRFMSSDHR